MPAYTVIQKVCCPGCGLFQKLDRFTGQHQAIAATQTVVGGGGQRGGTMSWEKRPLMETERRALVKALRTALTSLAPQKAANPARRGAADDVAKMLLRLPKPRYQWHAGKCLILAKALLHLLSKAKLVGFRIPGLESPDHVGVVLPDGTFVDAFGSSTLDKARAKFARSTGTSNVEDVDLRVASEMASAEAFMDADPAEVDALVRVLKGKS